MAALNISAIGDFATGPIKGADFIKLAGSDKALPSPPRFTFGAFPPALMTEYYKLWGIGSIGVFRLQDFELAGRFLLKSNEIYYRCPELNIHEAHIFEEFERISASTPPNRRRVEGPHVFLSGPGHSVYGHWLAEYLPKISLLHFAQYELGTLKYLLPINTANFVFEWLNLIGIRKEQISVYDDLNESIVADELLLPTIMHNGLRVNPIFSEAVTFLRRLIERHYDLEESPNGPRIFLSRAKASQGRSLRNRAKVEELASRANFTIVFPEELSLVDQVRLFVGAREIMGEYGSALHGSIFSPEGTVICAVRGNRGHPGFIQSGIGTALRQPTGYIFGDAERDFSFEVDEEAVATALRLVYGGLPL